MEDGLGRAHGPQLGGELREDGAGRDLVHSARAHTDTHTRIHTLVGRPVLLSPAPPDPHGYRGSYRQHVYTHAYIRTCVRTHISPAHQRPPGHRHRLKALRGLHNRQHGHTLGVTQTPPWAFNSCAPCHGHSERDGHWNPSHCTHSCKEGTHPNANPVAHSLAQRGHGLHPHKHPDRWLGRHPRQHLAATRPLPTASHIFRSGATHTSHHRCHITPRSADANTVPLLARADSTRTARRGRQPRALVTSIATLLL